MEIVRLLVGVCLPYLAIVVFVAGMIYRIHKWRTAPSPTMTLFPAAATGSENTVNTVKEILFFKSLFQGDRVLWAVAWVFHAVLLLIFLGHFRVFTNVDVILMKLGMSEEAIQAMSSGAGGAAGIVILLTVIFLLARRFIVPKVAQITGPGDYLALVLIGVILITGNMMRFGAEHFDLSIAREYFSGLATFSNVTEAVVLQNNVFLIHMFLALILLMIIPFSKILHLGGVFFTHQLIRKS